MSTSLFNILANLPGAEQDANTRIVEACERLQSVTERVRAEAKSMPDDRESLAEEQEMWVPRWEAVLVRDWYIRCRLN